MIDGAILGVFLFALGAAAGMALAAYHYRIVQQQQAQIDDLTDYIADHSDTEANAEDLWGHG